MIKNIVFDLGNVILKGTPSIVLNSFNLDPIIYNDIRNNFFSNLEILDKGLISLEEFFNQCKFSVKITNKIKNKLLNYYVYRPMNKDILRLIKKLKNNGYDIYILSNNNKETAQYIQSLPFFRNIDGYVFSCDYNIVKPNKEIYKALLKKYKLQPEECYFIDDSQKNIDTAKKMNMECYLFNNDLLNLEKELKNNNINIL